MLIAAAALPAAGAPPDVDYHALWRHTPLSQQRQGGEMLPNFDRWLAGQGVSFKATPTDLDALAQLLDPGPALDAIEYARRNPHATLLRQEACDVAIRSLYSALAEGSYDVLGGKVDGMGPRGSLRMGHHRVAPGVFNAVPYRRSRQRAARQATNLVDPTAPRHFLEPVDLDGLSHEQVAALDLSPNNPMWHTRDHMRRAKPDTHSLIERELVDAVSAELGFRYPLERARNVMFWRKLPPYGTSPKIKAFDAYGQKWNYKWGEEAIVEPVANQLRLLLGAKHSDLNYAESGGRKHLLVLPADPAEGPVDLDGFIKAMETSVFEFNARPYIAGHGVVTAELARQLSPPHASPRFAAEAIAGRTWIRFKESMVEASHDATEPIGPVTLYTPNALGDRAHRQSLLFSLWMYDTDTKEANYKAKWTRDGRYVEYFHDTGSSLGGAARSAEINELPVRSGPRGFLYPRPGGRRITSGEFQVFRPGAWSHVTHADHLAAAMHIVHLTQDDLRAAALRSTMPDYWQQTLVWRLAKRRDIIAERFGLTVPDPAGPAPTIAIPLTTRAQRQAAADRYRVPLSEIEADLQRAGVLPQLAGDIPLGFHDTVVETGVLQPYERTVLPGIIRDHRHPSGITDRITRFNDGRPYRSRRFEAR